jgi:hypothetical protein
MAQGGCSLRLSHRTRCKKARLSPKQSVWTQEQGNEMNTISALLAPEPALPMNWLVSCPRHCHGEGPVCSDQNAGREDGHWGAIGGPLGRSSQGPGGGIDVVGLAGWPFGPSRRSGPGFSRSWRLPGAGEMVSFVADSQSRGQHEGGQGKTSAPRPLAAACGRSQASLAPPRVSYGKGGISGGTSEGREMAPLSTLIGLASKS